MPAPHPTPATTSPRLALPDWLARLGQPGRRRLGRTSTVLLTGALGVGGWILLTATGAGAAQASTTGVHHVRSDASASADRLTSAILHRLHIPEASLTPHRHHHHKRHHHAHPTTLTIKHLKIQTPHWTHHPQNPLHQALHTLHH
ncbi:MAG TPA: hypothetical protein VGL93_29150, partial [Streptosporangiaceae bacterium]